jgi:hypothetical protein
MRFSERTPSIAAAALAAALSAHCTSASTNVSAPSGDKCQVSASTAPMSYEASGGGGTLTITAQRECTWTVAAEAGWVSLNGPASGQGDASLAYVVAANVVPAVRVGAIVVGEARLQLTQAAAPCRYELSQTSDAIGSAGGSLSFGIATLTGCPWTASSSASWIAVASGASGNASGTVAVVVGPNGGAARVGQVTAGGQTFTVNQAAIGTAPAPPPAPTPPPVAVDFEGRVSGVTGTCPALSFSVSGTPVVTSQGTEFRSGACRDLSGGDRVRVRGLRGPDGVVAATRIDFKEDDD